MKNLFYLFLLCSIGTFVACDSPAEERAEEIAENTVNQPTPTVNTTVTTPTMPGVDPASTLQAVQQAGGLTKLAPSTAVSVIDGYVAKLSSMDGTEGITNKLNELKRELTAPSIDGSKVAALLKDLGTNTQSVAGGNSSLMQLGQALSSAGEDLD